MESDLSDALNEVVKLAVPPPNADINQLRDLLRETLRELRNVYKLLEIRIFVTKILRPNTKICCLEMLLLDLRQLIKTPVIDQKKYIIQHLSEIKWICDIKIN